jgi:hypothetical protein
VDNLSYLAGLVDGEGHVSLSSAGRGKKRFVIEIKMTSEKVIDWLVSNFNGAKQFRPSTNPNWKDQWRWRLQGNDAIALYNQIKPMLLVK